MTYCPTSYAPAGEWNETEMSWVVGNATFFKDVRKEDFTLFGNNIGLNKRFIESTLSFMLQKIESESNELLKHVEEMSRDERPSAGELRHLRTIVHGVIKDMIALLQ